MHTERLQLHASWRVSLRVRSRPYSVIREHKNRKIVAPDRSARTIAESKDVVRRLQAPPGVRPGSREGTRRLPAQSSSLGGGCVGAFSLSKRASSTSASSSAAASAAGDASGSVNSTPASLRASASIAAAPPAAYGPCDAKKSPHGTCSGSTATSLSRGVRSERCA
eukprot:489315-Prymnesium_polylepis.1